MCIAILTTPNKSITSSVFDRCWDQNMHGVGFAYITGNGEVAIDKGWMVKEAARKRYFDLVERHADKPMLIHFRAATVGGVDAGNCHPFPVKGGAMIHNGTFWRDSVSKKSDSRQLAEIMHNQLHVANLRANKEQFQEAFGYNRVVFLFKGGEYNIFSEDYNATKGQFGQWHNGIWYSNGGWRGSYGGYYGDDDAIKAALDMKARNRVVLELAASTAVEDDDALANLDKQLWGKEK